MTNDANNNQQKQEAKTNRGNVTQVGGNYTQTRNTKISVWISVIFIAILAIGASVLLRIAKEIGIDIFPTPTPTQQSPR